MTTHIVRVYSKGGALYPDRAMKTYSAKRARERMERLRREGYMPKLLTIPPAR